MELNLVLLYIFYSKGRRVNTTGLWAEVKTLIYFRYFLCVSQTMEPWYGVILMMYGVMSSNSLIYTWRERLMSEIPGIILYIKSYFVSLFDFDDTDRMD